MPTAAILPVKRFSKAKQRLEPALGAGSRTALAAAMFADVLAALRRAASIETVLLVSGEETVKDVVVEADVTLIQDRTEKGQSQAALSGLARASALGYDSALLIPGDTPLIDAQEIDDLVAGTAGAGVDLVIVPDRHGTGTNALLTDPSSSFQPQFGPDSLQRHVEQARRRALRHEVQSLESLALDIDTGDDLAELRRAFERHHGRGPRTQGVLKQIDRSQGPIPV
jgi:2-phospho-L-lactate/phosphoenolpyruvate guanylyltransferase